MRLFFEVEDIYGGLIKAFVFGTIIAHRWAATTACAPKAAPRASGSATTRAVVVVVRADARSPTTSWPSVIFQVHLAAHDRDATGSGSGFGAKQVLRGIDLDVDDRRDARRASGGRGTGKSVLLKHIIGLMHARRRARAGRRAGHRRRSARTSCTTCAAASACCSRAPRCSTR